MTISVVSTSTFIADTVILVRDDLRDNLTDPISAKRSASEKFVLTAYPERPVQYPIITVRPRSISDIRRLGMQSTVNAVRVPLEIRVWARNERERAEITQAVLTRLRSNQFGSSGVTTTANLFDPRLEAVTDVDPGPGENNVKSRIMIYSWLFMTT